MTRQLDVKPRHREQLERLLRAHLPGVEVWAYGSRVNGRSHEGSDLDLVLRRPGLVKIDPSQLAEFNEAVQESTIPFLIEARDWARLPDSFQREIEREYVEIMVAGGRNGLEGRLGCSSPMKGPTGTWRSLERRGELLSTSKWIIWERYHFRTYLTGFNRHHAPEHTLRTGSMSIGFAQHKCVE